MSYVLLSELADEFGLDRSNARKYVLKNGFSFVQVRQKTGLGGRQKVLALSVEDAVRVRELRDAEGFTEASVILTAPRGFFYIIQPVPELDPNRVKLGYAADTKGRLDQYKTICPTAAIVKSWSCLPIWEQTVIASVTRTECERIGVEVYQCDDVAALVQRAVQFFELMPSM